MRIILVSAAGDGLWLARLLSKAGHDVHWALADDYYEGVLDGLLPENGPTPDPEDADLIFFDFTGYGRLADKFREVTPVIGDSVLADKLELDRIAGIEFMEHCGIKVPPWEQFDNPADALTFLRKNKKRYVFKPCGAKECSATYVSSDHEDMSRYIELVFKRAKVEKFILQEFVPGTEVSTEMWVSGGEYTAVNHTIEQKKFMPGDLGPNTGCSGSLVWMPNKEGNLFIKGLKKAVKPLSDEGYVGMIDLNAIVTESEVYGLEWTPRCGYDAIALLTRLLPIEFGEFLYRVATGDKVTVGSSRAAFAASIRLSIPPYPLESRVKSVYNEGVPVEGLVLDDLDVFYASDIRLRKDHEEEFESAGKSGFLGCPIGLGETPHQAFKEVETFIRKLKVPNLQWRNDVPEKCCQRYAMLSRQGWLG
jgi:phosphoribosylamine--glycine ligase